MENQTLEDRVSNKNLFKSLFKNSKFVFKRFLVVFILSFITTVILLYLTDIKYPDLVKYDYLYKTVFVLTLAIPLYIAYIFAIEQFIKHLKYKIYILSIISSLMVIYYFYIDMSANDEQYLRQTIFVIVAVLVALCAGFVMKYDNYRFWQFLRTIINRFLIAFVFSFLLFAGLSLAIWSVEQLFLLKISEDVYLRLLIILFGIVFPWLFLSGVPIIDDFESYHHKRLSMIKFFSKNVLLPLIIIYLLIVYAYFIRILVTFTLPDGWISYISSGLAILCLLFVNTTSTFKDEVFPQKLSKIIDKFNLLLIIPALFILLSAYIRIKNYGMTESRYFLVLWSIWLLFYLTLWQIRKRVSLRIMLLSIAGVLMFSIIGPWNAMNISEQSQIKRLEQHLTKMGLFNAGKLIQKDVAYTNSDAHEIISIVEYLMEVHGSNKILNWIPEINDSLIAELNSPFKSSYSKSRAFLSYIHIEKDNYYEGNVPNESGFFNFYCDEIPFTIVKDFHYYIPFNVYESNIDNTDSTANRDWNTSELMLDKVSLKVIFSQTRSEITIYNNIQEVFRINLLSHIHSIDSTYLKLNSIFNTDVMIPEKNLCIERENDKMKMKMQIKSVSGVGLNNLDSLKIKSLESVILLKIK